MSTSASASASTSALGSLLIITCNEQKSELDLSRHFNLALNTTSVIKTPGGRTEGTVASIHEVDKTNRIAMIFVVQHTDCPYTPGSISTIQENIRTDVRALRADRSVRNEIIVLGYTLDTSKGKLSEVNVAHSSSDAEERQRILGEMKDFGPFWC